MINKKNLYVEPLLTNISLAYRNPEDYIAEKVFPVYLVNKDTGKIASYDMDNLRIAESERSQGSPTNEVSHKVTIASHYNLIEHALKELVADEEEENADPVIKPRIDAVENLTDRLLVEKEKALSTLLNSTSNITQYTTLTTATQWQTYTTSDPVANVRTAVAAVRSGSGKKATSLIIAKNTYDYLIDHPDIIERIKYAKAATKDEVMATLARIFDLEEILVGNAQYNNSLEGGTNSLTDIWSHFAVVAYIEKNPRTKSRTLGYTYTRKASRFVDSWRDEDRKGMYYRVTDKFDQQLVDEKCAYLIAAATA